MEVIEQLVHNNRKIEIVVDPDPPDPREWDNPTIIVSWVRRESIGDLEIPRQSFREIVKSYLHKDRIVAILPLYAYIHSGIRVRTEAFDCPWDSGQAGWALITESKVEEFALKDCSKEQLLDIIRTDVDIYDAFLNGNCYGWQIIGFGGEVLNSCWGYWGLSGNIDICISDAKKVAEDTQDPWVENFVEEISRRATYAG